MTPFDRFYRMIPKTLVTMMIPANENSEDDPGGA
jgi:hypothetical protein